MVGGIIISLDGSFDYAKFVISWIILFAFSVGVVLFKVERKNAQRVKTDKTGAFDSINTLNFYDDRIVMENKELKSTGELKYDQFFYLMESKDYFIFYLTVNQASLVRKKDIDDLHAFKEFIVEKFRGKYKKI
ncbi:MAG TPA: YcxB family protein [Tissierellia bacterium]|nr:YcxB family protein [Tissierellia bacterium]